MQPFDYQQPADLPAASQAAAAPGARLVGGGTNLLDLMKVGVERPIMLVDLRRASATQVERMASGGLRLGAGASNTDVAAHPLVRESHELLSRALLSGASAQIRNRATVAGNLLQRTRCPYFYNTDFPCNKRAPGQGCAAREGYNRMHAIFGASDNCVATHPSDMAVALTALDARVEVRQRNGGQRQLALPALYRLPGATPHLESTLESGELITAVTVPRAPAGSVQIYRKVRDRASYAFALVSVAAVMAVRGGRVTEARLACGGVAPRPWRRAEPERLLLGERPTAAAIDAAAKAAVAGAEPLGHNAFKVRLLENTLRQVLGEAAELARRQT